VNEATRMPGPDDRTGITPDQRRHLLEALREVPAWRCSLARWHRADQALRAVADALAADDADALDTALTELALAETLRVRVRLGDDTDEPPEQVRDRVDRILYSLTEEAEPDPPEEGRPRNAAD
jgi:hypothetical protein